MAHRVISLRRGNWSLSAHSGHWQAVHAADLWVHGLATPKADDDDEGRGWKHRRGYYAPPGHVYYYAPPVYYAPRPMVVYPAPSYYEPVPAYYPPPGLTINIPLR
jgi:hypothetical protein